MSTIQRTRSPANQIKRQPAYPQAAGIIKSIGEWHHESQLVAGRVLLGQLVTNLLQQLDGLLFGRRLFSGLFLGFLLLGKLGLGKQRLGHVAEFVDRHQNADIRTLQPNLEQYLVRLTIKHIE